MASGAEPGRIVISEPKELLDNSSALLQLCETLASGPVRLHLSLCARTEIILGSRELHHRRGRQGGCPRGPAEPGHHCAKPWYSSCAIPLARNEIGDEGAAAIAGVVRQNDVLTKLYLCTDIGMVRYRKGATRSARRAHEPLPTPCGGTKDCSHLILVRIGSGALIL